jgi:hypothetical protein
MVPRILPARLLNLCTGGAGRLHREQRGGVMDIVVAFLLLASVGVFAAHTLDAAHRLSSHPRRDNFEAPDQEHGKQRQCRQRQRIFEGSELHDKFSASYPAPMVVDSSACNLLSLLPCPPE